MDIILKDYIHIFIFIPLMIYYFEKKKKPNNKILFLLLCF